MKEHLSQTLAEIREAGLYKEERLIESPQEAAIQVKGKEVKAKDGKGKAKAKAAVAPAKGKKAKKN